MCQIFFRDIYISLSCKFLQNRRMYDRFLLQGSILNHGLSLLRSSFRKGYIRNSSLRIWNTAKRGGVPRFPHRKIETREHLRLIAPLSQSFPCGSNSHDFPLYISILTKVYLFLFSFPFFSLAPDKRGSSSFCILSSMRSVLPSVR